MELKLGRAYFTRSGELKQIKKIWLNEAKQTLASDALIGGNIYEMNGRDALSVFSGEEQSKNDLIEEFEVK